jgi:uncharacterized membrane protein YeaQ/YmgE (transglycosylase-associated protein family)
MIWSALMGLLVGVVAKFVMPGKDPGGYFGTALLGIVGAVVASWIGGKLGFYRIGDPVGFIAAVIGAMVILLLYRVLLANEATTQN